MSDTFDITITEDEMDLIVEGQEEEDSSSTRDSAGSGNTSRQETPAIVVLEKRLPEPLYGRDGKIFSFRTRMCCPACSDPKKYKYIQEYNKHWITKHEKYVYVFKCPVKECPRTMRKKHDVLRHAMKTHTDIPERELAEVEGGLIHNRNYVNPKGLIFGAVDLFPNLSKEEAKEVMNTAGFLPVPSSSKTSSGRIPALMDLKLPDIKKAQSENSLEPRGIDGKRRFWPTLADIPADPQQLEIFCNQGLQAGIVLEKALSRAKKRNGSTPEPFLNAPL